VQPSLRNLNLNFQAFVGASLVFLLSAVAFLPQAKAGNRGVDPNALQKIQHFIYKPKPTDLLLPPKQAKPKKAGKTAKN
jgi:hypothetical protein